jgi:SAM-dependent methyltransferase
MAIKRNKDAYGQEVWHAFQGKEPLEIIERDDGFIDVSGSVAAYFAEFRRWPKWQKRAIRLAGGRVLDIGCGAGRVGLYLQERGLQVTCIDNSPLAIKVCRARGVKNAKVMPIEEIHTFRSGRFDTVVMFGNNFGLFGSFHKGRRLLKELRRITAPGALIIAETLDPYQTDIAEHLSYHRLNRRRRRMGGQIRLRVRFRNAIGNWFDYLLVSKEELDLILAGTGWKVREYLESGGPMYIAVIERTELVYRPRTSVAARSAGGTERPSLSTIPVSAATSSSPNAASSWLSASSTPQHEPSARSSGITSSERSRGSQAM